MALKKMIEIEGQMLFQSPDARFVVGQQKMSFMAYCKVINVSGSKSKVTASVLCSDKTYKVTKSYEIPVSTEDGAPNFIKQAYDHLKTLPEWADATDC